MVFTKRLRDRVKSGEITCSVRIWQRPHVKVGGRYAMDEGEIEIDSIEPIGFYDITPALAQASGFSVCSTFSKLRNMVRAKISTWSVSTIYRGRKRLASALAPNTRSHRTRSKRASLPQRPGYTWPSFPRLSRRGRSLRCRRGIALPAGHIVRHRRRGGRRLRQA